MSALDLASIILNTYITHHTHINRLYSPGNISRVSFKCQIYFEVWSFIFCDWNGKRHHHTSKWRHQVVSYYEYAIFFISFLLIIFKLSINCLKCTSKSHIHQISSSRRVHISYILAVALSAQCSGCLILGYYYYYWNINGYNMLSYNVCMLNICVSMLVVSVLGICHVPNAMFNKINEKNKIYKILISIHGSMYMNRVE